MPKPLTALGYRRRGSSHFKAERYHEAIADFTCAIELEPQNPALYIKRCDAYYRLGMNDLMAADQRHAARLTFAAKRGLTDSGEIDQAYQAVEQQIAELSRQIALDPANLALRHQRFDAYMEIGEVAKALEDIGHATSQIDNQTAALAQEMQHLSAELDAAADTAVTAADQAGAVVAAMRFQLEAQAETFKTQGDHLMSAKAYPDAVAAYTAALEPDDSNVHK